MFIEKIKARNIIKYEDLNLEFNKGVVAICGKNGSGKTTILEMITWCLTGDTISGDKICNSKDSFVSMIFHLNDKRYFIKRRPDKVFIKINGKAYDTVRKREGQDFINKKLGFDFNHWSNFVYFNQNKNVSFINGKASDRYKFFESLIDFSKIDNANIKLKEKINNTNFKTDNIKEKLEAIYDVIESINIKSSRQEIERCEDKNEELEKSVKNIYTIGSDTEETDEAIKFLELENNSDLNKLKKTIHLTKEEISIIRERIISFAKTKEDITDCISENLSEYKRLNYLKSGVCHICKNKIDKKDNARTISKLDKLIEKQKVELKNIEKQIDIEKNNLEEQISIIKNYNIVKDVDINLYFKNKDVDISEIKREISDNAKSIHTLKEAIKNKKEKKIEAEELESELQSLNNKLKRYKKLESIFQYELKLVLVKDILDVINFEHNKAIEKIDDGLGMGVEYVSDIDKSKRSSIDLKIIDNDQSIRSFKKFSGGEKQRIMVSGFYALGQLPKYLYGLDLNILMLDEAFPFIDNDTDIISNFSRLGLEQVFIVTHKEDLHGIDQKILIEKINNKSKARLINL